MSVCVYNDSYFCGHYHIDDPGEDNDDSGEGNDRLL
jgi:hypothetical protein